MVIMPGHILMKLCIVVGDWLGVEVTYFGKDMSTVLFLKNGLPIATRLIQT